MTQIINSLDEASAGYRALYCDLWGCLHNGVAPFPDAIAALRAFRERGGAVVLLTNSPRPARHVAEQLEGMGAPRDAYDIIVSSGDAAQEAMAAGMVGRKVYHLGPERDLGFFHYPDGAPIDVVRVPLEDAEGIVCTGLFDDRTETPEDYRSTILYGKTRGLKLLCANPDIVVDVADTRIYCAGAIAAAYSEAGGESLYFGKPHPPIYALARRRITEALQFEPRHDEILCVGDGILTDIAGAMGEDLDAVLITGGLAAEITETTTDSGPDPHRLRSFLDAANLSPKWAMAFLR